MFDQLRVACLAGPRKCLWKSPPGPTSNSLGERNDSYHIIHDGSATVIFWTLCISFFVAWKDSYHLIPFYFMCHFIFSIVPLFHLCTCGEKALQYINCSFTKLTFEDLSLCSHSDENILCETRNLHFSYRKQNLFWCFLFFPSPWHLSTW